ncbi:MAG: DUF2914 domain-containing protein [Deltaproteobacteria bacterium CG_4_8_14_3_um_filter_51_11]|nr:DUF2914 domain-containing protein [bacterium]NCP07415.1 DUF2914 domain-containing protein [bacterium]PIP46303.1 MAG: hypothetical protein COX16_09555 [Deltaproteobacteria bacterium CG23_combo_of_CG06-09_8_20_14_all_51_20]PIX18802.1 MAG: DUF2914 domain-containing protein [Deltaproteobacteria bacterium CG_4_8_14_3_um_filter_51_11]PJB36021.1 MAG: DUF2914 domain-containing protein [Deltaproteobacteria bacterium CG_4_9_14_3_um_filter_51_14]
MVHWIIGFLFIVSGLLSSIMNMAPESFADNGAETVPELTLAEAAMGEGLKDGLLQNQAVAFSVGLGRVICYSSFDPVPQRSFIYHNWYYRDRLSTRTRLVLMPPRWNTYSYIQLREADKGPWRVEITTEEGRLLRVLRFSITD